MGKSLQPQEPFQIFFKGALFRTFFFERSVDGFLGRRLNNFWFSRFFKRCTASDANFSITGVLDFAVGAGDGNSFYHVLNLQKANHDNNVTGIS